MAEKGKYIGDVEYGRLPYAGTYVGDVEYGRLPGIGYKYYPVLTVQSTPDSGVTITVSPNDINGQGDGQTEFTRTYEKNTVVTLTAPAAFNGKNFKQWKIDGTPSGNNPINVTMDAAHTVVAEYEEGPPPSEIIGIEMLKVIIPRYKFWISDYPNLDPNAEGMPIPERYGIIENITPICIDTQLGKYKLAKRTIKAIDQVKDGDEILTANSDYSTDLPNSEFTIFKTPYLQANTTYYFVIEGDFAIDGINYIKFAQRENVYADGQRFEINGAGVWTPSIWDLQFRIWGKNDLNDQEEIKIDNWQEWSGWNAEAKLRDSADRTRIAMSFKTLSDGFYISKICVAMGIVGSPSGNIKISILSQYTPSEQQVGAKSYQQVIADADVYVTWPQRGETSDLKVAIKGYKNSDQTLMENIADILKDVYVNILGGSESKLNAADLAALKTARPEPIDLNLDREFEFKDLIEKFEAGQLFKFLPNLEGEFTAKYYQSGEPSGTPHLRDEHISNFKMSRVWKAVFQKVKVKFNQDASSGEWEVREQTSNIAQYCYNNQESLELETYLRNAADATQFAKDYLGIDPSSSRKIHLQYPMRIAEFDVSGGYGFNLIPTQKIKITRKRADYEGGELNGVLFRILEISKDMASGTSRIKAVLDSLTY